MRLLCITDHGDTLNSVRPEAEIFIGLARSGMQVTVMTQANSVYAQAMREAGVDIIDFVPQRKFSLQAIRFIRSTVRSGHYEIVYAFNNLAIANAAMACIGLPTCLITYRGQTGNISRWDPAAYLTHLHPRVDHVICVSRATRDKLRAQVRDPARVISIYKGHDLGWYQDSPAELSEFGIPPGAFVVISVANNRPRKGVPVFIQAAGMLPPGLPIWFLLVGSGMDAPQIRQLVQTSPYREQFVLAGRRTDAPSIVAACQVSVLPSIKREGLPKTVIEAMAYGVATIVSDSGGSAELVEDGVSGIVVPPGDAGAIARAIERLYANPTLRQEMGRRGRERITELFNVKQTVREHLEFFEKIAGGRKPARG